MGDCRTRNPVLAILLDADPRQKCQNTQYPNVFHKIKKIDNLKQQIFVVRSHVMRQIHLLTIGG